MRRLHIPFMLLLALYVVAHFGSRVREAVSNLTEVAQAHGRVTETHYAPGENLERLDLAALRSTHHTLDICMYTWTVMETICAHGQSEANRYFYKDLSEAICKS